MRRRAFPYNQPATVRTNSRSLADAPKPPSVSGATRRSKSESFRCSHRCGSDSILRLGFHRHRALPLRLQTCVSGNYPAHERFDANYLSITEVECRIRGIVGAGQGFHWRICSMRSSSSEVHASTYSSIPIQFCRSPRRTFVSSGELLTT